MAANLQDLGKGISNDSNRSMRCWGLVQMSCVFKVLSPFKMFDGKKWSLWIIHNILFHQSPYIYIIHINTRNDGHLERIISTKFCRSQFCCRESKSLNLEEILLIQLSLKQNLKKETHIIRGRFGGNPLTKASFGVMLAEVTLICLAWSGPRVNLQRHNFANILGRSTVSSYYVHPTMLGTQRKHETVSRIHIPTQTIWSIQKIPLQYSHTQHLFHPINLSILFNTWSFHLGNDRFQAASDLEHRTKSCGMRSAFFPACHSLTGFLGVVSWNFVSEQKMIIFLWNGRNFGMEVHPFPAGSQPGTWRFFLGDFSSLKVEDKEQSNRT